MDAFTHITAATTTEEIVFPPVNDDSGTGSSGSCVVCKADQDLPPVNEDSGTGSSGSCVVANGVTVCAPSQWRQRISFADGISEDEIRTLLRRKYAQPGGRAVGHA
ncbi:hypothetical protein C8R46DRAFT_1227655 [Mycena filopes]|nr:hypothetical protein C8R46DRAFT_1227655 [Mycena filopes]